MNFDEWLEAYFSGTQIDDVVTGMMRTAFEAGRCEAEMVVLRDSVDATNDLRDQFAMAALQGFCTGGDYDWQDLACDAYKVADAMLKERVK